MRTSRGATPTEICSSKVSTDQRGTMKYLRRAPSSRVSFSNNVVSSSCDKMLAFLRPARPSVRALRLPRSPQGSAIARKSKGRPVWVHRPKWPQERKNRKLRVGKPFSGDGGNLDNLSRAPRGGSEPVALRPYSVTCHYANGL